jgi:hypothetical protein
MPSTLVTLAMIKANHEVAHRDYLDTFVPFVAYTVYSDGRDRFTSDDIKGLRQAMEASYGIRIPHAPMVSLLSRAVRQGYLKRSGQYYYADKAKLSTMSKLDDLRAATEKAWTTLIAAFIAYCAGRGTMVADDQANAAFLALFSKRDVEIVFARHHTQVLRESAAEDEHVFLAMAFTRHVSEADLDLFEFIASMATGHLLAVTLLSNQAGHRSSGFRQLFVYLDVGIILRLLGITTSYRQSVAQELVAALSANAVQLRVFDHTVDEALGLLQRARQWIGNAAYDPSRATRTTQFIIDSNYTVERLDDLISTVTAKLREHSIEKVPTPEPMVLADEYLDENLLTQTIIDVYTESNPDFNYLEKKWTIQLDIRSITAIHKFRRGLTPHNLREAKHVFVTSSFDLARAASLFDGATKRSSSIPTCITDLLLGTLFWMDSPAELATLNRQRLMADCVHALQPDRRLLTVFFDRLETLLEREQISDTEYRALRIDATARTLLSEVTHNLPERFSDATADEVIEAYRRERAGAVGRQLEVATLETRHAEATVSQYTTNAGRFAYHSAIFISALLFGVAALALVYCAMTNNAVWSAVNFLGTVAGLSALVVVLRMKTYIQDRFATMLLGEPPPVESPLDESNDAA